MTRAVMQRCIARGSLCRGFALWAGVACMTGCPRSSPMPMPLGGPFPATVASSSKDARDQADGRRDIVVAEMTWAELGPGEFVAVRSDRVHALAGVPQEEDLDERRVAEIVQRTMDQLSKTDHGNQAALDCGRCHERVH